MKSVHVQTVLGCVLALWFWRADRAVAQCDYDVAAVIQAPDTCGVLGPPVTVPTAMNDHGVVTGYWNCVAGTPQPFMWSEEMGFVAIPLPEGVSDATPADINNHNEIVGVMNHFSTGDRAFHYKDGVWTELPLLAGFPQARAHALNHHGRIVGEAFDPLSPEPLRAVTWQDGFVSRVELPHGPNSAANAVNDNSVVGGWMGRSTLANSGFLQTVELTTVIPKLVGADTCEPNGINDSDAVCGDARVTSPPESTVSRSWVYSEDGLVNLGILPGTIHTVATDINDASQIVGTCFTASLDTFPFVWQHDELIDLRDRVQRLPEGLFIGQAVAINNRAEILCRGVLIPPNDAPRTVSVVVAASHSPVGDVNFDCVVDEHDIMLILDEWGPARCGEVQIADKVTSETFQPPADGRVDGADLAVVLGSWTEFSTILERSR